MNKPSAAISKAEWMVLLTGLALIAALALRPSIRGNDGVGHYVYLASLLRHGGLDFTDEYRAFDAIKRYSYHFSDMPVSSRMGLPGNRYGIGAAILWSPFVLVLHGALRLWHSPLATALSPPYEWAVGIGTAFWGSVGLGMLYRRLRKQGSILAGSATVLGLVFATPLGFYLYAHGSMSHGVSFFAATGAMLAFERAWRRPAFRLMIHCGFWFALLVMIRVQDLSWVIVLAGALAWRVAAGLAPVPSPTSLEGNRGPGLNPAKVSRLGGKLLMPGLLGLSFFIFFMPQMAVWKILYGSWASGPMPYLNSTAGSFSMCPRHLTGVLFGERGGVVAWHPLIAIGLLGLLIQTGRENPLRLLAITALAGFAAQLWLVASWSMWWGGASFGNRFFISSLPFLSFGSLRLLKAAQSRLAIIACYGLLLLLIIWNFGLLFQYATQMTPRETWIPWTRVIRQNVVDVPALVWRKFNGGKKG